MPDVIRLRAVYRFAARSLRPVEFALASVTSSIVPNVIRAYPPRRPARFGLNAGVAHAAARMSIPADSIRHVFSALAITCGVVPFCLLVGDSIPAASSILPDNIRLVHFFS